MPLSQRMSKEGKNYSANALLKLCLQKLHSLILCVFKMYLFWAALGLCAGCLWLQ